MGQHRALRHAGGAGRVDDHRDVVRPSGGKRLVDQCAIICLAPFAELEQRCERHQVVLAIVPHALHVDADDAGEIGQAALEALGVDHLVGLLLVAADHQFRPGVADDVLQLGPGVGRIDAEAGAAQHLRGHVGIEPFGRVLARHREAIAGAEAEGVEGDRAASRVLEILPPRNLVPDAAILFAQRQLLWMRIGATFQDLRYRQGGECRRGKIVGGHAADLRAPR